MLFFFSFFWAYTHYYLNPPLDIGMSWPPSQMKTFDYLSVPLMNTLILLTSSMTATIAHSCLNKGGKKLTTLMMTMTIFLGLMFSAMQFLEYKNSFFSISDSSFGSIFFVLTGFHGIHVIIGSMFLMTSMLRFYSMSAEKKNSMNFEMASWYWHFVDLVWMILYLGIYYLTM